MRRSMQSESNGQLPLGRFEIIPLWAALLTTCLIWIPAYLGVRRFLPALFFVPSNILRELEVLEEKFRAAGRAVEAESALAERKLIASALMAHFSSGEGDSQSQCR